MYAGNAHLHAVLRLAISPNIAKCTLGVGKHRTLKHNIEIIVAGNIVVVTRFQGNKNCG